jgi:hypothetical protein
MDDKTPLLLETDKLQKDLMTESEYVDRERNAWSENRLTNTELPKTSSGASFRLSSAPNGTTDVTTGKEDADFLSLTQSPESEFSVKRVEDALRRPTSQRPPSRTETLYYDNSFEKSPIFDDATRPVTTGTPEYREYYDSYRGADDYVLNWFLWLTSWVSLYVSCFVWFLLYVAFKIPWKYGFYGDRFPYDIGWVDDRYSFVWILMLIALTHVAVPASVLYVALDLASPFNSELSFVVTVFGFISSAFVSICLLCMLIVSCNNGVFRNVACDDVNTTAYCARWANSTIRGCPSTIAYEDDSIALTVNPTYYLWIYYSLGCVAYSFLTMIILSSINKYRSMGVFFVYDRPYYAFDKTYRID